MEKYALEGDQWKDRHSTFTVDQEGVAAGGELKPPVSLQMLIDDLSLDILLFSFSIGGPIPSSPSGPK